MAYHKTKSVGFGDERRDRDHREREEARRTSYSGVEMYRPPRDSSRDRNRDRARVPPRRPSNWQDPRDLETDRSWDRDRNGSPRHNDLRVDTSLSALPRGSAGSPVDSPLSSRQAQVARQPPSRTAERKSATGALTSTVPTAKAKDPEVQEQFALLSEFQDSVQKRSRLLSHRDHLRSEIDRRKQEGEKQISLDRANDFPSVHEMAKRFQERDELEYTNNMKELLAAEKIYYQNLESLAVALHGQSRAQNLPQPESTPSASAESVSNLEKKFGEFEKKFSESLSKIQELESGRRELKKAVATAKSKISELEKLYSKLDTENARLTSENASLVEDNTVSKTRIDRLESDKIVFDDQFVSVESAVRELRSSKSSSSDSIKFNQKLDGLIDQVEQCRRDIQILGSQSEMHQKAWSSLSKLQEAVSENTRHVSAMNSKFQEIDWNTMDEVQDRWVSLNIEETLSGHDDKLANLSNAVHLLKELGAQGNPQSNSTDGSFQVEVEAIREDAEKMKTEIYSFFEDQFRHFQQSVTDTGQFCADEIDEVKKKVEKLEEESQNHDPSNSSNTSATIPQLNASARSPSSVVDNQLEGRVKILEDQKLAEFIDQELENFRIWISSKTAEIGQKLSGVQDDIKDQRDRYDALQLSVNVINEQYNNIFTKPLADMIVKQLDNYGQRLAPRIESNEQRMSLLSKELDLTKDVLRGIDFTQKRSVSPSRQDSVDSSKRRRTEVNGEPAWNGNSNSNSGYRQ